ncbi:hypothetical protein ABIC83_003025 [Roseateles asaccharophilus]|uniref:hypothetical protein n=1 Tax=Roseateles asaccharophilus TaxID=582607 RepID=UPI003836B703
MTPAKKKFSGLGLAAFVLFAVLLFTDRIPNPLERYFEIGPGLYHTLGRAVDASRNHRLQFALKEALEKDGKLTQHNMRPIWPVYMDALPDGFVLNQGGEKDRDTERRLLIEKVGATPAAVN